MREAARLVLERLHGGAELQDEGADGVHKALIWGVSAERLDLLHRLASHDRPPEGRVLQILDLLDARLDVLQERLVALYN